MPNPRSKHAKRIRSLNDSFRRTLVGGAVMITAGVEALPAQTRRSVGVTAFIAAYEKLLNALGDDEVVPFADAVHPIHAARPVGCWAPKEQSLAIERTSGRERIDIPGAVDLETGQTGMIEADTVDAISTIQLLESPELPSPSWSASTFFWTTRAIITPSSCANGCRGPAAGSNCISSPTVARI